MHHPENHSYSMQLSYLKKKYVNELSHLTSFIEIDNNNNKQTFQNTQITD